MKKNTNKGKLGSPGLSLSKTYIYPPTRRRLFLGAGVAIVFLAGLLALNISFFKGSFLSNGPVSSAHSSFSGDCQACHTAYKSVSSEKCSDCHETGQSELKLFSFTAHYLYHTDDFQRDSVKGNEMPCSSCHPEHLGRNASLTQVSDNRCLTCHEGHSFDEDHPVFAKVTEPEQVSIKFPHVKHVAELTKKHNLAKPEDACVMCHRPSSQGDHFLELSFDRECDACHLNASEATPRLPLASAETLGVRNLQNIKERAAPGSRWALFANPNEYLEVANRFITKSPLHHQDPWVLENLRDLRRRVYPDAGLADLIRANPDVPATQIRGVYAEAVETLEGYALELRARPEAEIQAELAKIEGILEGLKEKLADPYVVLDETEFLLALDQPNQELSETELSDITQLANDLTQACQTCHVVSALTLQRIAKDQRSLSSAKFNHKAHLLQKGCLDCHNRFPDGAFDGEYNAELELNADVLNLPNIDSCRECHSNKGASNSCLTCHQFHPKSQGFSAHMTQDP